MEKKIYFGAILTLALILSMVSISSAIQTSFLNVSVDFQSVNFWGLVGGMLFITPTYPIILENVTSQTNLLYTQVFLRDVADQNGANLATSTSRVGNIFLFDDYILEPNHSYWLVASADGTHGYAGFTDFVGGTIATFPVTNNDVTWTTGWNPASGASDTGNGGYDIKAFDFEIPVIAVFNMTAELTNPVDNASVTVPLIFTAQLFVINSNITNATLYVWNSTGLVLTDFKTENIVNTSSIETWTETLPLFQPFTWNVQVCAVNGQCEFDEENETFTTIPTPIPNTQNPNLIHGSGLIYDVLNSAGAGLGSFIAIMGVALPTLLIGLGFVAVIISIAFGITHIIKVSMNRG